MDTDELDYYLPQHLIAQHGLKERDHAKLLVLHRDSGRIECRRFCDLGDFLQPGDCLVLNNTKVIPARFFLVRATGGRIEGLLLNLNEDGCWQVLLKNASRIRPGETLRFIDQHRPRAVTPSASVGSDEALRSIGQHKPDDAVPDISITARQNLGQGNWLLDINPRCDYLELLERFGSTPLPPYIRRGTDREHNHIDRQRYQTIYACRPGSVAAPTAGLHFTSELIEQLRQRDIRIARVTLHVGLGTFKPVTTDRVEDHPMHTEQYRLDQPDADLINRTIEAGRNVLAVGTTSVRTLETLAQNGRVRNGTGWTNLLITPGYRFQVTSMLLTNFHLPRTTLLALVCAFAGVEQVLSAYARAVELEYRFYSYGDAMLVL